MHCYVCLSLDDSISHTISQNYHLVQIWQVLLFFSSIFLSWKCPVSNGLLEWPIRALPNVPQVNINFVCPILDNSEQLIMVVELETRTSLSNCYHLNFILLDDSSIAQSGLCFHWIIFNIVAGKGN